MIVKKSIVLLALAVLCVPSVYAVSSSRSAAAGMSLAADSLRDDSLPAAPSAPLTAGGPSERSSWGPNTHLRLRTLPFSQLSAAVTLGSGGLGLDLSTPLMTKVSLRVGASFLNYSPRLLEQGIPVNGTVRLRAVNVGLEYFPYRGSFHVTPGVTLYNGNHVFATTYIAPGAHFTIDDTDYVSDPTNPVHGFFDMTFGKKIAPSITVGWGNMLQRRGGNWSVPVDFGFEYLGRPKFVLNMDGGVCTPSNGCDAISSDESAVQNLAQQQKDVNEAIGRLRFFPILKVGVAYRFGHTEDTRMWR